MTRTTVTLPNELNIFLEGAVRAGYFSSKSEIIQEAIDSAFENDYRRVAAVLSLHSEGKLDAMEALKLADVKNQELRFILMNHLDIEPEEAERPDEDILSSIYDNFSIEFTDEDQ